MTVAQAQERVNFDLRVTKVLDRYENTTRPTDSLRTICEVCDNEFCYGSFVVVQDEHRNSFYVDAGPVCTRDILAGLP